MVLSEFIALHKDDDIRTLALQKMPEGIDAKWVLQQIEGYQIAKKKLPTWVQGFKSSKVQGVLFPPRLSLEQCSSESTARYKAQLVLHSPFTPPSTPTFTPSFIDLTAGFGVDFSYMAQGFQHAIYVEPNEELCHIARHNLPILGLPHAQVINTTCEQFLSSGLSPLTSPLGSAALHSKDLSPLTIYLDPSRRSSSGHKVMTIEDCTPNLLDLQDRLLEIADTVIVKLSPMLDITDALRKLKGVTEVHVVSVKNECKELLFVMKGEGGVTIHCVNLETDEPDFIAPLQPQGATNVAIAEDVSAGGLLFVPNSSILKAGLQDVFAQRYGLRKLAPNSHLYVQECKGARVQEVPVPVNVPVELPARQFRLLGISDFSKASLKTFLRDIPQANLAVRNFPSDVATLRRRLKIKEGGSDYLFATTLADGTHVLLRCQKVTS